MSELDTQTREWVDEALALSYEDIAETCNIDFAMVHRGPTCRKITQAVIWHLALDHNFTSIHPEERAGWQIDGHSYGVINQDDDEFLVEGTWQQFLPPDAADPKLPRALIGTREEVIKIAHSNGVDFFNLDLWAPRHIYEEPRAVIARHPSNSSR